jgi:hypothetical protein
MKNKVVAEYQAALPNPRIRHTLQRQRKNETNRPVPRAVLYTTVKTDSAALRVPPISGRFLIGSGEVIIQAAAAVSRTRIQYHKYHE